MSKFENDEFQEFLDSLSETDLMWIAMMLIYYDELSRRSENEGAEGACWERA